MLNVNNGTHGAGAVCVFALVSNICVCVFMRAADSPAGLSSDGLAAGEVAVQTYWGLWCSFIWYIRSFLASLPTLSLWQKQSWWTREDRADRSGHRTGPEPWDVGAVRVEGILLVMFCLRLGGDLG